MAEDDDDDLRWRFSPRTLLFLIPGYLSFASKKGALKDPLDLMRQAWLAFFTSLIAFGVVGAFAVSGSDEHSARPWIVGLSLVTAASLIAQEIRGRKPLDANNPSSLVGAYRTRFFLQVALSNLIALGAFVAMFTTGQWWVYWVFLPFALFGLWRAAPTKSHLLYEDEQLRAAGYPASLTAALRRQSRDGAD